MDINATDQLKERVDRCTMKVKNQMRVRGVRAANEMRNASNLVLRGQRSGRIYRVPHSKRYYQASAPGEPPAVRTGALRQSFVPRSKGYEDGSTFVVEAEIHTNTKYAGWLDEGTAKMAARPYSKRIQDKAYPKVKRIFEEPYDRES